MNKLIACVLLLVACAMLVACGGDTATVVPTTAPVVATSTPLAAVATPTTALAQATATMPLAATEAPTMMPTAMPTMAATEAPTLAPTEAPTAAGEAPTQAAGATATLASGGGASDVVVNAMIGINNAKSYRMQGTTISAGTSETLTIEVVRPDRMHATTSNSSDPTANSEFIVISDTFYSKTGDAWTSFNNPGSGSALASPFGNEDINSFRASMTGLKSAGTDTVNGTQTQVYEFTTTLPDEGGTETGKIWIAGDGLARRIDSSVSSGSGNTSQSSFLIYDYNADISIEAPAGAVPMPTPPEAPTP